MHLSSSARSRLQLRTGRPHKYIFKGVDKTLHLHVFPPTHVTLSFSTCNFLYLYQWHQSGLLNGSVASQKTVASLVPFALDMIFTGENWSKNTWPRDYMPGFRIAA